jgi:hypothetical protein
LEPFVRINPELCTAANELGFGGNVRLPPPLLAVLSGRFALVRRSMPIHIKRLDYVRE